MTRARDTSRVQIGINTAVIGADEFTYFPEHGLTITENLSFHTANAGQDASTIVLERTGMIIASGVGITVGEGKNLIINPHNL